MKHQFPALATGALAVAAALAAGCGSQRSDAEHQLLRWTEALNFHLASSFDEGNQYPVKLVDIDPMLRVELKFEDPWGAPVYYRRVNDSMFDLASGGPDGILGNDDDVVIQDRKLTKPKVAWERRPLGKELVAQSARDRPSAGSAGALSPVAGGGEAEAYVDESADAGDSDD
jgi:hypothetical protein